MSRSRTPVPNRTSNPKDHTMFKFLIGVLCGIVSGAVTWTLTNDSALTGLAALVAAVLAWLLGGLALVLIDE